MDQHVGMEQIGIRLEIKERGSTAIVEDKISNVELVVSERHHHDIIRDRVMDMLDQLLGE